MVKRNYILTYYTHLDIIDLFLFFPDGFQINGYVKLNDLRFTPEMTDPSNREFQVLARNLEKGITEEFCNGLNCRTNIVVFQQGKTNIRKNEFLNAIHFSASSYQLLYGYFQNMRRPKSALYSIYVIGLLNNNHKKNCI